MIFSKWLDTFVEEKGLDTDEILEVEGASGMNWIPLEVLLDAIKTTSRQEQIAIKAVIVKLDFINADCLDYFKHLAKAIARVEISRAAEACLWRAMTAHLARLTASALAIAWAGSI